MANTEVRADYEIPHILVDRWVEFPNKVREFPIDYGRDLQLLGFSAKDVAQIEALASTVREVSKSIYTGIVSESSQNQDSRQQHGRTLLKMAMSRYGSLPFSIKGLGNWKTAMNSPSSKPYPGFGLPDKSRLLSDRRLIFDAHRINGAMQSKELIREHINGIVEFSLFNSNLNGALENRCREGIHLPVGVFFSPTLTSAIKSAIRNGLYFLSDEQIKEFSGDQVKYGAIGAIEPSTDRFCMNEYPENEHDYRSIARFKDPDMVKNLARKLIHYFEYGVVLDFTSWHPQNIYTSQSTQMPLADLQDHVFLGTLPEWLPATSDYLVNNNGLNKKQLQVYVVAACLLNFRFFPDITTGYEKIWSTENKTEALRVFFNELVPRFDSSNLIALLSTRRLTSVGSRLDIALDVANEICNLYRSGKWDHAASSINTVSSNYLRFLGEDKHQFRYERLRKTLKFVEINTPQQAPANY